MNAAEPFFDSVADLLLPKAEEQLPAEENGTPSLSGPNPIIRRSAREARA
jgi:hypothetical protein